MAISAHLATFILKEHKYKPITGDILMVGRQTVVLTTDEAISLLRAEGVEPRSDFTIEIDQSTVRSSQQKWITDRSFFSLFSDGKVIALDVSDYEAAELIHDLNVPLPAQYNCVADFIFNGSVMDDLFDPAMAIKCMSKLLRPHGRIMHIEAGTQLDYGGAFLCYSPEWFFDFYAINNYKDCKIYGCAFKRNLNRTWRVFEWSPFYEKAGRLQYSPMKPTRNDMYNLVIAEKGELSTDEKTPIRANYRELHSDDPHKIYYDKFRQYKASERQHTFALRPKFRPPSLKRRVRSAIARCIEELGLYVESGGLFGRTLGKFSNPGARFVGTITND